MQTYTFKPPALEPAIIDEALRKVFALQGEERLNVPLVFKDAVQALKRNSKGIDESGLAFGEPGTEQISLKAAAVVHLAIVAYSASLNEYNSIQAESGNQCKAEGAYAEFLKNARQQAIEQADSFFKENENKIINAAKSWDFVNRFAHRVNILESILPQLNRHILGDEIDVRYNYQSELQGLDTSSHITPEGKTYHMINYGDDVIKDKDGLAGAMGLFVHEFTHIKQKTEKDAIRKTNGEGLCIASEMERIKILAQVQMMIREHDLLYLKPSANYLLYCSQPCEAEATMKGGSFWREVEKKIAENKKPELGPVLG